MLNEASSPQMNVLMADTIPMSGNMDEDADLGSRGAGHRVDREDDRDDGHFDEVDERNDFTSGSQDQSQDQSNFQPLDDTNPEFIHSGLHRSNPQAMVQTHTTYP